MHLPPNGELIRFSCQCPSLLEVNMKTGPYRILVVDDLDDWRMTLSGLLRDEGYEVDTADSVDSAWKQLAQESYDLAVVDMRLDETDESDVGGLTLSHRVRQERLPIRIIILTGYASMSTIREAMESDSEGSRLAMGFIQKDATIELLDAVKVALSA